MFVSLHYEDAVLVSFSDNPIVLHSYFTKFLGLQSAKRLIRMHVPYFRFLAANLTE